MATNISDLLALSQGGTGLGTGGNTLSGNTTAQVVNRTANVLGNADTNITPVSSVDTTELKQQLAEREENEKKQAELQADKTVQDGITELQRAEEDAQPQFQTQRNQVDIDERKALDNQALYNAAKGENGGLGTAQYNSIQNTAATNRATINAQQTQLATDTARQIADLKAQGEFEKANQLLTISNAYLKELSDLEQWATEQNISVAKFNAQLKEWENEYYVDVAKVLTDTELDAAKQTGSFSNGMPTYSAYNDEQDRYAAAGKAMMSAGFTPSYEQLQAMGYLW